MYNKNRILGGPADSCNIQFLYIYMNIHLNLHTTSYFLQLYVYLFGFPAFQTLVNFLVLANIFLLSGARLPTFSYAWANGPISLLMHMIMQLCKNVCSRLYCQLFGEQVTFRNSQKI